MNINIKLTEARQAAGLTQEQVAEAMDISRQTLSNWETGKTSPDAERLREMASLYGISISAMLDPDDTDTLIPDAKTSPPTQGAHVKTSKRTVLALACLAVPFVITIPWFWIIGPGNEMGFTIVGTGIILPIMCGVGSAVLSAGKLLGNRSWLCCIFYAVMADLTYLFTFGLANRLFGNAPGVAFTTWFSRCLANGISNMIIAGVASVLGYSIGAGSAALASRVGEFIRE